jgi:DNA-binding transcriptional LysR family regulator
LCDGIPVTTAALRGARWVLREQGSGTRAVFEEALEGLGLRLGDLNIAFDLPSNEAVRGAVEAGAGVTVVSKLVVARALKAGTLATGNIVFPSRHFYSLRHREHHQTQAARAFLALASEARAVARPVPGG